MLIVSLLKLLFILEIHMIVCSVVGKVIIQKSRNWKYISHDPHTKYGFYTTHTVIHIAASK